MRERCEDVRSCKKCGISKPIAEFRLNASGGKDRKLIRGRQCRECLGKIYREYRKANREKLCKNQRKYYKEYYKANQDKVKARTIIRVAYRNGSVPRPDKCSKCGKKCTPEASHNDYSKPLEVEWLCHKCHGRKDRGKWIK